MKDYCVWQCGKHGDRLKTIEYNKITFWWMLGPLGHLECICSGISGKNYQNKQINFYYHINCSTWKEWMTCFQIVICIWHCIHESIDQNALNDCQKNHQFKQYSVHRACMKTLQFPKTTHTRIHNNTYTQTVRPSNTNTKLSVYPP